jgi:hypothetical protein
MFMGRLNAWLTKKHSFKQLKFPLLLLIVSEFLVVGFWFSGHEPRYHAQKGYLVKHGRYYIVFWQNENREQDSAKLDSLKSAIKFAHDDLALEVPITASSAHPLESLWMKNNLTSYALYWKTLDSEYLNRLTFYSQEEAESFKSFFQKGAYTPSPIGHSIALLPIRKNE